MINATNAVAHVEIVDNAAEYAVHGIANGGGGDRSGLLFPLLPLVISGTPAVTFIFPFTFKFPFPFAFAFKFPFALTAFEFEGC